MLDYANAQKRFCGSVGGERQFAFAGELLVYPFTGRVVFRVNQHVVGVESKHYVPVLRMMLDEQTVVVAALLKAERVE